MIDINKSCTYNIQIEDLARVVEFSPYGLSCKLLAIGTNSRIIIISCRFPEEDAELKNIEYEELQILQAGCAITALSWSPDTSVSHITNFIKLAAAGMDHNIRLVSFDLKKEPVVEELSGHKSFINAIAYEPNVGQQLASVGDDNTCRIWETSGEESKTKEVLCFYLMSPGVSVCWHYEEPKKILVAQKNGIIRFFSLHNQQPIMSLDCGQAPLMAADWCHINSLAVVAAAATDWILFDSSVSSGPADKKQAHPDGITQLRWCKCSDNLLATIGHPGCQVKLFNVKGQQLLMSQSYAVGSGLTWHLNLPIFAVGGDKFVYFWSATAS
ncbi:nucleoporin Nup37 [Octopus bimaculoides]|uniref:Nucleoporin Nup37 n=1 Tax=Octopus bimaculoides TaxID=37653 RepID=A0A0L8HY41_OCTBM|nr:nucleoporin Nup37 [Octopus bimaculoides]|eukprot:XP_014768706.1 PREDICTED: nucleoporin Nup37-like [Octopus bimaculoides]